MTHQTDLLKLQDMLSAMQRQRDASHNREVALHAEIAQLTRTLAQRDSAIKLLGEELEKLKQPELPKGNGATREGATVQ